MKNKFDDPVWTEYNASFANNYDEYNYDKSLQSIVMSSSHKFAEKKYSKLDHFSKVLEIGAGTGEHLVFVRHTYDEYVLTDHNSKTLDIAKKKLSLIAANKVSYDVQAGDNLNYPDNFFDRLIATHVLEHIYEPQNALNEWSRVIKNNGIMTIIIPTDPGLLWRFGRNLGPRRRAISRGIPYDYIMAREHVNPCGNLISILRYMFPDYTEGWWPTSIPSIDLNLFFAFHARIIK